jgi:hypothetical protein
MVQTFCFIATVHETRRSNTPAIEQRNTYY